MKCIVATCKNEAIMAQHGWTCLEHDMQDRILVRIREKVERLSKFQPELDPLIVDVNGKSNYDEQI